MVYVRFPEYEGNAPLLEKAADRLFTDEYGRSFAEYLLPDKILGDSVIDYCIEHTGESLQDLL